MVSVFYFHSYIWIFRLQSYIHGSQICKILFSLSCSVFRAEFRVVISHASVINVLLEIRRPD
jgi:hypothetical protein